MAIRLKEIAEDLVLSVCHRLEGIARSPRYRVRVGILVSPLNPRAFKTDVFKWCSTERHYWSLETGLGCRPSPRYTPL